MDRKSKIVIGLFVAVILGIIITELVRPRPINWRPSYTAEDTIPFGCFVLYNELPSLFANETIEKVDESVYDILVASDSTVRSNYLFINEYVDLDEQETYQLLEYVRQGNSVFISSTGFGWKLMDTLKVGISSDYGLKEGTALLDLTHNKFKGQEFELSRGIFNSHFTYVDSTNTTILGHITYTKENFLEGQPNQRVSRPNFIKTKFGNGNFYIHSTPQAYSNYYMLKGNHDYVAHTFSYLQDTGLLYWDNYKKSGRIIIDSPMRFVLTQASLKWAYYLTVLGLLLFVLFRGKREQRIIPVIKPLENATVGFTQAVGSLYYQNKDYTDLVHKKLNYFLAELRSRYYIDTNQLNERTVQILAARAGKQMKETKDLIDYVIQLKRQKSHTEKDSIELNKKITAFKQ